MNYFRTHFLRFLLPLALAGMGAGLCAWLIPAEMETVKQQLIGFPDSDVQAHQARPMILAALCFLPLLAGFVYSLGGTMDRYIARQFGGIFCVCLAALAVIWLLMDLSSRISDFRDSKNILYTLIIFYGTRSPAVLLLLLPYSLLLALLYSLGKFSGTREIIAMIQGGRSVIRITMPLIIAGMFLSLLSLGLNYHWAPDAEGRIEEILDEAGGKLPIKAPNVLYRNPADRRLWEIGAFPKDYHKGEPLIDVEVTTTREDKTLESRLYAKHASWDRTGHRWTFEQPLVGNFPPNSSPVFETHTKPLVIDTWPETPWQLIKPGLSAANLGIPDLDSWLLANTRRGPFADPAPYLTQWH